MLICATCGVTIDGKPYYDICHIVPFCSQQHARHQQRHNCSILQKHMEELIAVLEHTDIRYGTVQRAFQGSILDMVELYKYGPAPVKDFLVALFPPQLVSDAHSIFATNEYVDGRIAHLFAKNYGSE